VQLTTNAIEGCVRGLEDLIVRDAKYGITNRAEPFVASMIALLGAEVVAAISLHDEPRFGAQEVNDERADRCLTSELSAIELATTQLPPEDLFRGCGSAAQRTSTKRPSAKKLVHRSGVDASVPSVAQIRLGTTRSPSPSGRGGWGVRETHQGARRLRSTTIQ
jgi:hypothetical protein